MNTLIESINKISKIKNDLNEVLRENGLEGGSVFTDYPDKFRELFRVSEEITSSISSGYEEPKINVITSVPSPTLTYYQNIVTVSNILDGGTVRYWIKTDSHENEVGVTALTKGNTIVVTESSTVFVYVQYRSEVSETVSIYVPWNIEEVPSIPTITRNGTTVTIVPASVEDSVYYSIDGSAYTLYSGSITVYRYQEVSAFSQNYRGRSDVVVDEAPERPVKPDTPTITCSMNVVTITCTTSDVSLYYRKKGGLFIQYTSPFTITESGYYSAKSYKDGLFSDESNEVFCEYFASPANPVFNVTNNKVYITSPTNGSTIYYKIGDGQYQVYNSPISLSETVVISAYSSKNGFDSDTVTRECEYVTPVTPTTPAIPVISCIDNIVTITCSTSGSSIYYKIGSGDYRLYTSAIEITETVTVSAYSRKDGLSSDTISEVCTYIAPVTPEIPAVPVFSISDNTVTITCSTINATIYYRDVSSVDWIQYSRPFTINSTTKFVAFSNKNGVDSDTTSVFTATYNPTIIVPSDPVIECSNNEVTITTSTDGAVIFYKIGTGQYQVYSGKIIINSEILVSAYSSLNGVTSNVVSVICEYYENPDECEYLYIEALTNGDLSWWYWNYQNTGNERRTIYVSKDKVTWKSLTPSGSGKTGSSTYSKIKTGEKVYIKGFSSVYGNCISVLNLWYHTLYFSGNYKIGGNIMSLIYGDNYKNKYTLSGSYNFYRLFDMYEYSGFSNSGLKDCSSLSLPARTLTPYCYCEMFVQNQSITSSPSLPATSLTVGCYKDMFAFCSGLETAPTLSASILKKDSYNGMFYKCRSLHYIKCLATDISAENCLYYWVSDVRSTGTFVKNSSTVFPIDDNTGIPTGWSVQNA